MTMHFDLLEETLKTRLPLRKRRELALAAKILFEEFQQAQSTNPQKTTRKGRIVKLVLFGSYARGTWVEDRGSGYFSDYDLLVVVDKEEYAKPEYWYRADDRLNEDHIITKRIKTPVEPIVHSINDINTQLAVGRPFFVDIIKDGITLYETDGYAFSKPGNMSELEKQTEAKKYFDEWYELSLSGLKAAKFCFNESKGVMNASMRDAAFLAHQATERIYHCALLTLKLYSPKMHNIKKLRELAEDIAPELIAAWPRDTRIYRRRFDLLRRAYIEARYSPHYKITAEELNWIFTRIEDLQHKVKTICDAHLKNKVY